MEQTLVLSDIDIALEQLFDKNKVNNNKTIQRIIKLLNCDENSFNLFIKSCTIITEEILTMLASRYYLKYNITSTTEALLLDLDLPFKLNNVYMGKSTIHGNGIFANKCILQNEIVTLYPPHIVFVKVGEDIMNYFKYKKHAQYNLLSCYDYKKSIDPNIHCGAFPQECGDSNWLGHLINDGSCKTNLNEYKTDNLNKTNCSFVKICDHNEICYFVAVVATKEIKEHEELFIQYGINYWINKFKE